MIDDVPENLEFARSTLQPCGFLVFTTTNVENAVAIVRDEKPDLVLCDLHMQLHNGLDLLDRLKSDPEVQRIPVMIISSTSTGIEDELTCLKRGAVHFVRRPIEPEVLLSEIGKILGEPPVSSSRPC